MEKTDAYRENSHGQSADAGCEVRREFCKRDMCLRTLKPADYGHCDWTGGEAS